MKKGRMESQKETIHRKGGSKEDKTKAGIMSNPKFGDVILVVQCQKDQRTKVETCTRFAACCLAWNINQSDVDIVS